MPKEVKTIEMETVGDFVKKHEYWVYHRRSKNYIAEIKGLDTKYGFQREFLDRVKMGNETMFQKSDFKVGHFYEFRSIYYTGSGHPDPVLDGVFKCTSVNGKVILEKVEKDEVIEHFSDNSNKERDEVVEQIYQKLNEKSVEELREILQIITQESSSLQG